MRIEHDSLIDVVLLQRARSLDRQQLHVDVRAVQRGALLRQIADDGRLHAVAVDEARNLDARVAGQIRNQAAIEHVAADHDRVAGLHRFHDVAGVFAAAGCG